jgi:hypothetical protein
MMALETSFGPDRENAELRSLPDGGNLPVTGRSGLPDITPVVRLELLSRLGVERGR